MERLLSLQARRGEITISPDDHATDLSIEIWFLTSVFLIMYISGQTVKYIVLGRLWPDDYLMLVSTLLAFGLSLAYYTATTKGFGNQAVPAAELDAVQKILYTADLLYIPTVSFVKLSLLALLWRLTVDEGHQRFFLYLTVLTALATIASIFAAAFQCHGPETWEPPGPQCFNQTAFWISFAALDILTDVSVVIAAALLVWNARMPLSHKATVIGCFAPRILVIAAAACRLAFLIPVDRPRNAGAGLWISVVCTGVQVCLSISTACVPSVKPLFEAIEAGVWQADDLRRRGLSLDDLHRKGYVKDPGVWMGPVNNISERKSNVSPGGGGGQQPFVTSVLNGDTVLLDERVTY